MCTLYVNYVLLTKLHVCTCKFITYYTISFIYTSNSSRFTYRSFSPCALTAATRLPHLESWSRFSRPPPRPRPNIPFTRAWTRWRKRILDISTPRPLSRPNKMWCGHRNPKRSRGHLRKCMLPVYTSSASPHTTRPARALSFPHPPLPLSPRHAPHLPLLPPAAASPRSHTHAALRRHPSSTPSPHHQPSHAHRRNPVANES